MRIKRLGPGNTEFKWSHGEIRAERDAEINRQWTDHTKKWHELGWMR